MTQAQHPQFSFLGDALLRLAAQSGAANVARELQRRGDDPFWPDAADSAFYDALRSGDRNLARQMLDLAPVSNRGVFPDLAHYLELALDCNDDMAVSLLLTFSVESKSLMPFEVLHAAIAADGLHRVESLIRQRGIAMALRSHDVERSVLHHAIRRGSARMMACLLGRTTGLARAVSLCARDGRTGSTALHLAAASGEMAKLRLMLDFDPDVRGAIDAEDGAGKTALALAMEAGRSDMAALLRSRGAVVRGS